MKNFSARGFFVTGTDTGVGKSIVTGALAGLLQKQGINVGVMKPVETGCLHDDGKIFPSDGRFLKEMSGAATLLEDIVPYQFNEPLAPSVAAQRQGMSIDINLVLKKFEELSRHHEVMLVEGAGGLLVPLCKKFFYIDLVKQFQLPLLIVSRTTLGTINHTLLTLRAALAEDITVAGIVLNHLSPERSVASETNPDVIAALTDIPLWGIVPYQEGIQPHGSCYEAILELGRRHLNQAYISQLISGKA
jgi:dethiobiotin synthetase